MSAELKPLPVKPLFDRILVDVLPLDEMTKSGLWMPHNRTSPPRGMRKAIVRATGPGRPMKDGSTKPMDLYPGDMILYPEHTGQWLEVEGQKYLMLTEDDAFAIVE